MLLSRIYPFIFLGVIFAGQSYGAEGRALNFDDLLRVRRLSEPAVSPDGRWVAYVQKTYDPETYELSSDIFLVPLAGGEARNLTWGGKGNSRPMFTPDGASLVFASSRTINRQFFILPLSGGGEAVQITFRDGGAEGGELSPDGSLLLFHSPALVDSSSVVEFKGPGYNPRARIIDKLLFRHWDQWQNGCYNHLFVKKIKSDEEPLNLTSGPVDCPPISLGSDRDYAVSPSGKYVYYVANHDPVIATSTNNDIWRVTVKGDSLLKMTDNPANDNLVALDRSGRFLAYRAMARPGFESDRSTLWLKDLDTGETVNLTSQLDRSVEEVVWDPAGKYIYFTAEDEGKIAIYKVSARIQGKREITRLTREKSYKSIRITPDSKILVALRESFREPAELVALAVDGSSERSLTDFNASILAGIEMQQPESFRFPAEDGVPVHGYLIRPPQFTPGKKYPLLFLIHGGPQGAWIDEFHYRWNAQLFASWGYVVVMVNPRGSTGYGQLFTDQISGDWGGKCYRDLMSSLDYVLEHYDFIDRERLGAAGASFGGYMINWIAGHTDRFRCLVDHDGVFNIESMYGSTEELWFPEWEFRGTPWENPELCQMWSPHRFAANFKTPMLIVHGEKDYRVPLEQGLMAFTTLRRKGIEARLLYFPEEGHWVLNAKNSRLWYDTIRNWFARYLNP